MKFDLQMFADEVIEAVNGKQLIYLQSCKRFKERKC